MNFLANSQKVILLYEGSLADVRTHAPVDKQAFYAVVADIDGNIHRKLHARYTPRYFKADPTGTVLVASNGINVHKSFIK